MMCAGLWWAGVRSRGIADKKWGSRSNVICDENSKHETDDRFIYYFMISNNRAAPETAHVAMMHADVW